MKKNYLLKIIVLGAFMYFLYGGIANAQTITVAEDSWVNQDEETVNHDGMTDIQVGADSENGKSREGYFMFDISEIKGTLTSASISFVSAIKDDKPEEWTPIDQEVIELFAVGDNWAEKEITWAKKSEVKSEKLGETTVAGHTFKRYSFSSPELISYVNASILAGKTKVAFAFKGKVNTPNSRIWISDKSWEPAKFHYKKKTYESLAASEDSWVNQDEETANHDGQTDLQVGADAENGKSREAYFKFNIKDYVNKIITSSSFSFVSAIKDDKPEEWTPIDMETVEIYVVDANWLETEINWSKKTAIKSEKLGEVTVSGHNFLRYSISSDAMVDAINEALKNNKEDISFVVKGKTNTPNSRIWISDRGWEPAKLHLVATTALKAELTYDTWVNQDAPDANHEGITDMEVGKDDANGKSREAYVQFDLATLVKDIPNAIVTEAGFSFMTNIKNDKPEEWTPVDDLTVEVYGTGNDWKGEELKWSNKPSTEVLVGEIKIAASNGNKRYFIANEKFAAHINKYIERGSTKVSFVIKGKIDTPKSRVWISSQEWEAPALNVKVVPSNKAELLADTWVNADQATENHEKIMDMQVGKNDDNGKSRAALVKFNISELKDIVDVASLSFMIGRKTDKPEEWTPAPFIDIEIYGTKAGWDGAAVTWESKPSIITGSLVEGTIIEQARYKFSSSAIADFINAEMYAGATEVSFIVAGKNNTPNSRIWISSQEWEAPKLYISTTDEMNSVPDTIHVKTVDITKDVLIVKVDKKWSLNAIISPEDAWNKTVIWTSSNTAIAIVSDAGVVSGISAGEAIITATSVDGGLFDKCVVTVEIVSGVDQVNAVDFSVYPNPSNNVLQINTSNEIDQVSIFNLAGMNLYTKKTSTNTVNVSSLPNGIYLIRVATKQGLSVSKMFTVKH